MDSQESANVLLFENPVWSAVRSVSLDSGGRGGSVRYIHRLTVIAPATDSMFDTIRRPAPDNRSHCRWRGDATAPAAPPINMRCAFRQISVEASTIPLDASAIRSYAAMDGRDRPVGDVAMQSQYVRTTPIVVVRLDGSFISETPARHRVQLAGSVTVASARHDRSNETRRHLAADTVVRTT